MRKTVLAVACALVFLMPTSKGQDGFSVLHKFSVWGTMNNNTEKLNFLIGWTNGFYTGPRSNGFVAFGECMEHNITERQAIAMVDKYYEANPKQWGLPVSNGIVNALTVKSGPCAGIDPWK